MSRFLRRNLKIGKKQELHPLDPVKQEHRVNNTILISSENENKSPFLYK